MTWTQVLIAVGLVILIAVAVRLALKRRLHREVGPRYQELLLPLPETRVAANDHSEAETFVQESCCLDAVVLQVIEGDADRVVLSQAFLRDQALLAYGGIPLSIMLDPRLAVHWAKTSMKAGDRFALQFINQSSRDCVVRGFIRSIPLEGGKAQ